MYTTTTHIATVYRLVLEFGNGKPDEWIENAVQKATEELNLTISETDNYPKCYVTSREDKGDKVILEAFPTDFRREGEVR